MLKEFDHYYVIKCDSEGCPAEVLQRTKEKALCEAIELGWRIDPRDAGMFYGVDAGGKIVIGENEREMHFCPDCEAGGCPAEAAATFHFGFGQLVTKMPNGAKKGSKIALPNGQILGVIDCIDSSGETMVVSMRSPKSMEESGPELKIADVVVLESDEAGEVEPS